MSHSAAGYIILKGTPSTAVHAGIITLTVVNQNASDQCLQDTQDPNPLIRALAVRTMGCIRVDKITEYLCDPLQRCLKVYWPCSTRITLVLSLVFTQSLLSATSHNKHGKESIACDRTTTHMCAKQQLSASPSCMTSMLSW